MGGERHKRGRDAAPPSRGGNPRVSVGGGRLQLLVRVGPELARGAAPDGRLRACGVAVGAEDPVGGGRSRGGRGAAEELLSLRRAAAGTGPAVS